MKILFIAIFFSTLLSLNFLTISKNDEALECADDGKDLFPIWINNHHGFINPEGKVLIKPIFRNLGSFIDGLAPARLNGNFGYINTEGVFVIPPIYDFATDFSEGFARVFQEGKLFFINKKGKRVWDLEMNNASPFEKGYARVAITKDSQMIDKLLDIHGQLHDFQSFDDWDEDLLIVKNNNKSQSQIGIKHKNGNMIVPFGKYNDIEAYHDGLAAVSYIDVTIDENSLDNWKYGYINRNGEMVFMLKKGMHVFQNYFSEGLLAVTTQVDINDINSEKFITWINKKGNTVFEKTKDQEATPYRTGRSFSGVTRNWYLMDKSGKQLGRNRFEWFGDNDFSKNRVLVAHHDTSERFTANEKWGVIDSMGIYKIPPQYDKICSAEFQKEGLLVAIAEEETNPKTEDPYTGKSYHWGLIDTFGKWLIKPKFTRISQKGFVNGLLYVEINDVYGYVNTKGNFVWQASKPSDNDRKIEPLNIAFMARNYNQVYPSDYSKSLWDTDNSIEKMCLAKLIESQANFAQNQLGIIAKTKVHAIFQESFKGFKSYVYNTTKDTLDIDVQDNVLNVTMQAIDKKGVWRDIEYMPSSWCGNSYYSIKLLPNEYWAITIPEYDGIIETTLRLVFLPKRDKKGASKTNPIYSNIFKGKVNPAQFWNKEGHTPTNLMDSYNE
jgi:WG containing repeat